MASKTTLAIQKTKSLGLMIALFLLLPLLFFPSQLFAWNQHNNFQSLFLNSLDIGGQLLLPRKAEMSLHRDDPLVLTTQISNSLRVNSNYQYEDQDIAALLPLRSQEAGLGLENTIILAPLSDSTGELENQLQEENIRYRNSIIEDVRLPHERTILIPVNLTQLSHWAGLLIKLDADSDIQTINYIDSLNQNVPSTIIASLQNVYGPTISIQTTPGLLQTDATSCGPLLIENLIRSASGTQASVVASTEKTKQIRTHHIILMEIARPDLNLKKRQQHNIRSFKDISGKVIETNILSKGLELYNLCLEAGLSPAMCGGGETEEDLWEQLPEELKIEILKNLDAKNLSQTILVSKDWRRITNDNVLWLHITQNKFDNKTIEKALAIYDKMNSSTTESSVTMDSSAQENTTKARNFKSIHYLCQMLSQRKGSTIVLKNKNTIEISSNLNLNWLKLTKHLRSPQSKVKILRIIHQTLDRNFILDLATIMTDVNCNLTELTLNYTEITPEGAQIIANALKDPSCKLTTLNIEHNYLGNDGIRHLSNALKDPYCMLTELSIEANNVGAYGIVTLACALQNPHCKLAYLNLAHNEISDNAAAAIAEALKHPNCSISNLNLQRTEISDVAAATIMQSINNPHSKLTELNFAQNKDLDDRSALAILNALKNPDCKLTRLDLAHCRIGDTGIAAIATSLASPHCKLTYLNFKDNGLTSDATQIIALALIDSNCQLRELDLSSNYICDNGADAIAEAIRHKNLKLTKLKLNGNQLGITDTKIIANALKNQNGKLTTLDLGTNKIDAAGIKDIAAALKEPNCLLTELNLQFNDLSNIGTRELVEALSTPSCKLTKLNLNFTKMGKDDIQLIAEVLKNPYCKLTELNLGSNRIDDTGSQLLIDATTAAFISKGPPLIKIIGVRPLNNYINQI